MLELSLINFRNHQQLKVGFQKQLWLICGANGVGKTAILEAIYFVATGTSFKEKQVSYLLHNHSSNFLSVALELGEPKQSYFAWYQTNTPKQFLLNKKETTIKNLKQHLDVNIFESKLLTLIQNSKTERKRFFDKIFIKRVPSYKILIKEYEEKKTLYFQLLEISGRKNNLNNIKNELNELAEKINHFRKQRIIELNQAISEFIKALNLELSFNIEYNFNEQQNQVNNVFSEITGLNRYDYVFNHNGKNSFIYNSEGINKVLVILLFIVSVQMNYRLHNISTILMIDDAFSHLDKDKIALILKMLKKLDFFVILTHQERLVDSNIDVLELR